MTALDIEKLGTDNIIENKNGKSICFSQLPIVSVDIESTNIEEMAVLSWRWDVNLSSNCSRNVYLACQEAKHQGIRYLFFDKVTINQYLSDEDMLRERLAFSKLYQELPVIAAYDYVNTHFTKPTAEVHGEQVTLGTDLSRIMRRPWIFYEVQLYRFNPTKVTYVGYIPDLGCKEDSGFLHMAERIWQSTICQTVLYTLSGIVNMHHVEDFRFIFPQYFNLLSAAHSKMSKNDYLLATALLAGKGSDSRINNDQDILNLRFDQFRIGEGYTPDDKPITQDYYTRYDIYLGNHVVGRWQTRHKFYPFEELRVWFMVDGNAESIICDLLGEETNSVDEQSVPIISKNREQHEPILAVVFHEKDIL